MNFSYSKFYGVELFIKISLTKFYLYFLVASPIILLSSIIIYIEDGFQFYLQNRTGWDGRRFKVYKLRSCIIEI